MRRRNVVYSGSKHRPPIAAPKPAALAKPAAQQKKRRAWRRIAIPAALALLAIVAGGLWIAQPATLTQAQVEAIVQRAIEEVPPKPTARDAFEKILPSVVAVRAMADDVEEGTIGMEPRKEGIQSGTGVVIIDSGIILTNLHVVNGMRRIHVTFSDGTDAEAELVGQRPDQDLAVLQAKTLPDDIMPAVMRSTAGLKPGDEVVAVGFPFGIGPSASSGVISGLKRDYISPEGKRMLSNLIQFDAAVNPGNSGGPLVTLDGELIGIVTGLLNPTEQRVFIGIGFAVPIENAAAAIGLSPF
ncbi:MAG TPA: trypsin-like peptidase domain-containing protein [Burkholderiales bacterium]|nr:trypsin-like peptidase domain-containing protein [Burkholderiales bacterium]